MTHPQITDVANHYTVLLLNLDKYKESTRVLPTGCEFLGSCASAEVRSQEKELLQRVFEDWDIPYSGRLPGWQADSPVFVVNGSQLIAGVYLCNRNEFDDDPLRGQLHYFFVRPEYRAGGIHSANVREAVRQARVWGLRALYVNTDRRLLPEVYIRWGAEPLRQIAKPSRIPHNALGDLVRRVRWRARVAWQNHNGLFD
ncbi:MAG: GNAT family N-acetyltransferase [Chloroflexi bacterium]|nr:GNAT family N-acetyltransferase [Chloroflexota bacterium]